GAVATAALGIALDTSGATATTVAASDGYVAPVAATGAGFVIAGADFVPLQTSHGDETYTFTVSRNGSAAVNVQLDDSNRHGTGIDILSAAFAINADLMADGSTIRAGIDGSSGSERLMFYDNDAANTG